MSSTTPEASSSQPGNSPKSESPVSRVGTGEQPQPPRITAEVVEFVRNAMAQFQRQQNDPERTLRPRMHMHESRARNIVVATIELPGMRKEEIQLCTRGDHLIVSGYRRPLTFPNGDSGRTVVNELKFGRFERCIDLPPGLEPTRISASMDDGMLTVSWPIPNQSLNLPEGKEIPVA